MTQADVSGVIYFLPILSFLIVFILIFTLLYKTKLVEDRWLQLFISFLFATVFISASGAKEYVLNIVPWFAVLLVCLFLILAMIAFIGKPVESMQKGIGIAFIIILIAVFLISAIFVFSDVVTPYLPGGDYSSGGDEKVLKFTDWLYSPRVMGAILLLAVSALVSWVLVKSGDKKDKK